LAITSMTELNYGLLRTNTSLVVRGGREPATSRFQVLHPNHSATLPPMSLLCELGLILVNRSTTNLWDHSGIQEQDVSHQRSRKQ